MKRIILTIAVLNFSISFAQVNTKRILFIGNSYTYYNDLPKMLSDIASSTGNSVIYDSNTPGGYTLNEHSTNPTSLNKIAMGNWDFVVLQEQSQLPSLPISQVNIDVFPYAYKLDSFINKKNPCAETIFYMTWGRKNGDGSYCNTWPPVCTYTGMDSLLAIRYKIMANANNALISPVGVVWKKVRQAFPALELYNADESHPSNVGTYVAACCFYTTVFRKNPLVISFNSTLSATEANNIKAIVKQVVYDSLQNWNIGKFDTKAKFTYDSTANNNLIFTNTSQYADTYSWDFGDGGTSFLVNPVHQFVSSGSFPVKLIVSKCGMSDTIIKVIKVVVNDNQINAELPIIIFPNPVKNIINIDTKNTNNLSYKILNALGEIIKTGIVNNANKQIDFSAITNGTYYLQFFGDNKIISKTKFIKL